MILDTSAIIAVMDRKELGHLPVVQAVEADNGPLIVPSSILAEIAHLMISRGQRAALDAVLVDVQSGAYALDCGEGDFARIRELMARYEDLPLSFADAAVIACAERNRAPVLTLDRDFGIVAREGTITVLPR